VIGLRVCDIAETTLPKGSTPLVLQDPEGHGMEVFASGRSARAAYERAWHDARSAVTNAFRGAGGDLVELRTDQSAFTALARFFRERRRKIHG
jgi:uncharacterized protein (DUF58 family)